MGVVTIVYCENYENRKEKTMKNRKDGSVNQIRGLGEKLFIIFNNESEDDSKTNSAYNDNSD